MPDESVPAPSSEVARPGEEMTPAEAYQLVAPTYAADGSVLPDAFERKLAGQPKPKQAAARRKARAHTPPQAETRPPDADSYDGSGDQEAENPGES